MFLFVSIPLRLSSTEVHPALPLRCASGIPGWLRLSASDCNVAEAPTL